MCSEPVPAHNRDEMQAVARESLDEKLMESPQLVLRSDRNKALIPDVDDTQVSVAAGEKMLLKALNSPRINWHNELPDEPDMPDSVEVNCSQACQHSESVRETQVQAYNFF